MPVIFDYGLDAPFSVIKALLSHALAYLLAGVLLGLLVLNGRGTVTWSWLHVPVLAFFVANVGATVFAADHLLALYGTHSRMLGLGTVADGVLLYFAVSILVRTTKHALSVGTSLLAGSLIVIAYEFVQYVGKDPLTWGSVDSAIRPFSTIGQATSLAEYLTVVAVGVVAVAVLQSGISVWARALLLSYAGFALAGTIVTQTRSGLLGLVAGGVVLAALSWASRPSRRARLVIGAVSLSTAMALVVILAVTPLGARFLSTVQVATTGDDDFGARLETSADARIALYRISLEMVRDRPWLGHGPDNFLASLPRYRSDAEPFEVQDNPSSSPHSWVAHVATTSGLIGLGAFVLIPVVGLVLVLRRGRLEASSAMAILGAYLGAGVTTVNGIATDWIFWGAAGVIASATAHPLVAAQDHADGSSFAGRRGTASRSRRRAPRSAATAYACVAIGFACALTTISGIDASRSAKASQGARLQGQNVLAIEFGLRATGNDSQRSQYWDTLGLAYVSADRLQQAVSAFERARDLSPYDIRYDGNLARALATLAQRGEGTAAVRAREVADRAIRVDPNNPRAHQTRAVVMQVTGNLPEAWKSSERALALDRLTGAGTTLHRDFYVTGIQVLNGLGRHTDAVALGHRCIERLADESTRWPIRIEIARSLISAGKPLEALREIQLVLAVRPTDPSAQQLRAQLRGLLGE